MASIYDLRGLSECPRANVVEWYILPEKGDPEALWVTIGYDRPQFPSIRFRNPMVLEEYRYKELLYSYDRSNDAQRTVFRQALVEQWGAAGRVYRLMLQEDILPSHRFPCSKDIQINERLVRRSFKINNRLALVEEQVEIDSEMKKNKEKGGAGTFVYHYYLRYQHAPNVDLDKMQSDLNQFISRYAF
jgi:hypothetical protein